MADTPSSAESQEVFQAFDKYFQKLETHNTNQVETLKRLEVRIDQNDKRIEQNEKVINKLDNRLVKLETIVERVDNTLTSIQDEQKELRQHIQDEQKELRQHIQDEQKELRQHIQDEQKELRQHIDGKFDTVATRIYWTAGIAVAILTFVLKFIVPPSP